MVWDEFMQNIHPIPTCIMSEIYFKMYVVDPDMCYGRSDERMEEQNCSKKYLRFWKAMQGSLLD